MSLYTYVNIRMEEIIQILIFVVAMVIAAIVKSTKSKEQPTTPSTQDVLEEVFPTTDCLNPEENDSQEESIRPIKVKKTSRKKQTPTVKPQETPSFAPQKQKASIKLSTREEARKAFIYSEIFNRKYQ